MTRSPSTTPTPTPAPTGWRRRRTTTRLVTAAAVLAGLTAGGASGLATPALALSGGSAATAITPGPGGNGYALISRAGGQYNYGDSSFSGSLAGTTLSAPIVDAANVPGTSTQVLTGSDGAVYVLGGATKYCGGANTLAPLQAPIVAVVVDRQGGMTQIGADGGTFDWCRPHLGSLAGQPLPAPIVDAALSADGRTLYLLGATGRVHRLGAGPDLPSWTGPLNAPMTALVLTGPESALLVARDGGVFTSGRARFPGSLAGRRLNAPVVDATAYGDSGLWLLGEDGGVFTLQSPFYGAATGEGNEQPPPPAPSRAVDGSNGGLVSVACPATGGQITVSPVISDRLSRLLAAAPSSLKLCGSGWRSTDSQVALRKQNCGTTQYLIYDAPSSSCRPQTARPGASTHEKGLGVDFRGAGGTYDWLRRNAGRFDLFGRVPGEAWHYSTTGY